MSGIFHTVSQDVFDIFIRKFPSVALSKSRQVGRQSLQFRGQRAVAL